jgi:hypothetical protein
MLISVSGGRRIMKILKGILFVNSAETRLRSYPGARDSLRRLVLLICVIVLLIGRTLYLPAGICALHTVKSKGISATVSSPVWAATRVAISGRDGPGIISNRKKLSHSYQTSFARHPTQSEKVVNSSY